MSDTTLARLYRPSPPDFFPEPDIIAMLDAKRNIVFYRKDLFDQLSSLDQSKVYHMSEKYLRFGTTKASAFK